MLKVGSKQKLQEIRQGGGGGIHLQLHHLWISTECKEKNNGSAIKYPSLPNPASYTGCDEE